ncbi:MAG TPA: SGNH/GDSL hydrolase family protein [Jatrophihabitans sp.]|jgi:lysophospholipase L1-like esterase|uniref:SGNH/GDSL hydrolase family protein n=1 Tax=Jatrophihabitans sp. TaxID=1932789 RepID=UPI002EDF6320
MTVGLEHEVAAPHCLSAREAGELLSGAPWRRWAVMGDSMAAGVGGPSAGYADVPWAERVVQALRFSRSEVDYLNTGQANLRTADILRTQLQPVLDFQPDLVTVVAGSNDAFSRSGDLAVVQDSLDAACQRLTEGGAHLLLFTVTNVFDKSPQLAPFGERIADLNDRIRALAGKHKATLVEMWDHPIRHAPDLMSADGIHFSMMGQAVLASEIVRALAASAGARP